MFSSRVKADGINRTLSSRIVRLKTDCSKLRSKVTRAQSRSRGMRAQIRAKSTSSSRMATELNNQTAVMNTLVQENMQKDSEIAELNSEIETLNDTVSDLQAMLQEQQAVATRLQTVLDQCRTENTGLLSERMEYLEALGNTSSANNSLVQENNRIQLEVSKLRSKTRGLRQESEQIRAENKDQHRLIIALLPELNRKTSELRELEDRHQRLSANHSRLQLALIDGTGGQNVLDMVAKDNEKYLAENEMVRRFVGESVNRYNSKLETYQMEEERIESSIQTCC
ncbi:hypothetical protein FB645_003791 [Coemansia sp. IMI 203386]|nr:hypothetical protein FB645_003791 [Coemansia sp. IMI 203386]